MRNVEDALIEYATQYTPPGSNVKSVINQWIHAIIYEHDLFAKSRGVTKNEIVNRLKKAGIYKNKEQFNKLVTKGIHIKPKSNEFTFIDLFAGIGGMRLGFQKNNGVCVFSSEFEKNAQETYSNNFGEFPFGDITKISPKDIPDHDILIGGFPCQPFSHAGLKLGIDDTRGTLFYNIAKILEHKRPKFALLENVKGLISHDNGHTLNIILKTLTSLGYKCIIDDGVINSNSPTKLKKEASKMVLRSVDFGVPQNRQRIYIVLWRKDLNVNFKYPEPRKNKVLVGSILEENPDKKYTISDKLWEGHKNRKIKNKLSGKGFGYGIVNEESEYTNTISARYYKDGSEILVEQKGKNPRKLTPREASRLQGFPKNFIINKSDVQAYKQFGNSVSVPVIEAIAKEIANTLNTI